MPRTGQHGDGSSQSPPTPSTETAFHITTTNENWRGKNDPSERRLIQNRINQRAFRERQRAGESSKSYQPRSGSAANPRSPGTSLATSEGEGEDAQTSSDDDDDDDDESDDDESESEEDDDDDDEDDADDDDADDDDDDDQEAGSDDDETRPSRPTLQLRPSTQATVPSNPHTGQGWDELAQLINRNFMQAALTNARHLSLSPAALQTGTPILTPRACAKTCPPTLSPLEIQHQLPHDPIIDIIPHARLRFNILRAIATQRLDPAKFSACMRRSGSLYALNGEQRRGGLIVWREAEVLASWELSEAFVIKWGYLLEGCGDFVAGTNVWRGRRGESLFAVN